MDESLVGLLRKSYKLLLADNMYLASYDSCNDIDLYGIENLYIAMGLLKHYEYWYLQVWF